MESIAVQFNLDSTLMSHRQREITIGNRRLSKGLREFIESQVASEEAERLSANIRLEIAKRCFVNLLGAFGRD